MNHNKSILFRVFCMLTLLTLLISCSEQGDRSDPVTNAGFGSGNQQAASEVDFLKSRLFDNPEDFDALARLADVYFESGSYIEAISLYDRALAMNPESADSHNDRGLALFYTGDTASALDSFKRANAADPGFIHAWLSTGFVLVSEGRYQEAIEPLNRVKELDGTGYLAREADKLLAQANSNKGP
jgi:tetratricopeptide (TPR) repeat protein